jgi:hypothetical protein
MTYSIYLLLKLLVLNNVIINKEDIGPMTLKVSAPFIVSPLTYIFNRIIDSGIYPNRITSNVIFQNAMIYYCNYFIIWKDDITSHLKGTNKFP